MIKREVEGI